MELKENNISIIEERCPDCNRPRPQFTDYCPNCGFKFKEVQDKRARFIKRVYDWLFGHKIRRKNTLGAFFVLVGLFLIFQGYIVEHEIDKKNMGNPEYYKVQEKYLGTDKYFLSSVKDMETNVLKYKMVGILILTLGLIFCFSKLLFGFKRIKHDKYEW